MMPSVESLRILLLPDKLPSTEATESTQSSTLTHSRLHLQSFIANSRDTFFYFVLSHHDATLSSRAENALCVKIYICIYRKNETLRYVVNERERERERERESAVAGRLYLAALSSANTRDPRNMTV